MEVSTAVEVRDLRDGERRRSDILSCLCQDVVAQQLQLRLHASRNLVARLNLLHHVAGSVNALIHHQEHVHEILKILVVRCSIRGLYCNTVDNRLRGLDDAEHLMAAAGVRHAQALCYRALKLSIVGFRANARRSNIHQGFRLRGESACSASLESTQLLVHHARDDVPLVCQTVRVERLHLLREQSVHASHEVVASSRVTAHQVRDQLVDLTLKPVDLPVPAHQAALDRGGRCSRLTVSCRRRTRCKVRGETAYLPLLSGTSRNKHRAVNALVSGALPHRLVHAVIDDQSRKLNNLVAVEVATKGVEHVRAHLQRGVHIQVRQLRADKRLQRLEAAKVVYGEANKERARRAGPR